MGYSRCLVVLVELRGLLLCMRAISVCVRVWLLRRNRWLSVGGTDGGWKHDTD